MVEFPLFNEIIQSSMIFYRYSTQRDKVYFPTHIRFSPWLIGVIGGYIMHEFRNRSVRIPKVGSLKYYFKSLFSLFHLLKDSCVFLPFSN